MSVRRSDGSWSPKGIAMVSTAVVALMYLVLVALSILILDTGFEDGVVLPLGGLLGSLLVIGGMYIYRMRRDSEIVANGRGMDDRRAQVDRAGRGHLSTSAKVANISSSNSD